MARHSSAGTITKKSVCSEKQNRAGLSRKEERERGPKPKTEQRSPKTPTQTSESQTL